MNNKTLNNPALMPNEVIIEFINNESSTTMADGDVIVKDLAGTIAANYADSAKVPELAKLCSSAYQDTLLGVVRCKNSTGVLPGERGEAIVRGFAPKVKYGTTAAATGVVTAIYASGTSGTAKIATAAATILPGAKLGNLLCTTAKTTAQTTVQAYIDVR